MVGLLTKVKFLEIHNELAAHFTSTSFISLAVSQAIKEAFPNTESKRYGKGNHQYSLGHQEHGSPTHDSSNLELVAMLEHERMKSRDLEARFREESSTGDKGMGIGNNVHTSNY